ncbi:MAG: FtsX-like permease family protein [Deinococcaceae bacterium]
MWILAFRNLLRHPWRTLATVVGVALGIAVVLGTSTLGNNIQSNLTQVFTQAVGPSDLLIAPSSDARSLIDERQAKGVASKLPGITQTFPTLEYYGVRKQDAQGYVRPLIPGMQGGVLLLGQDLSQVTSLGLRTTTGVLERRPQGIWIPERLALRWRVAVGDDVTFVSPVGDFSFRVQGFLSPTTAASRLNLGEVGVVDLPDLQKATHLQGKLSYLGLQFRPKAPDTQDWVLPTGMEVIYPAGRSQISTGLLQNVQSGLEVLAAVLMALAGFLTYNTFSASVVERRREFALLRTLGLTRKQVFQLGITEGLLLCIPGTVLGVVFGIGIAALMAWVNALLLKTPFVSLALSGPKTAVAIAIGVATVVLAAVKPAHLASRVSPTQASREAYKDDFSKSRWMWGVALFALSVCVSWVSWPASWQMAMASLAMGLSFWGVAWISPAVLSGILPVLRPILQKAFGVSAQVGLGIARRSSGRNGVAIGTVALGVTLVIGVGGMVSGINQKISDWVDGTVMGDLFVAAAVPFPSDFANQLRKNVQLTEVSPVSVRMMRFQPPTGRNRTLSAVFTPAERYDSKYGTGQFQFLEGSIASSLPAFYKGGGVYISGTLSDRYNLHVGSPIKLRTQSGWTSFKVVGVVVDYTSAGESVVLNMSDLARFGGGSPDLYVLSVGKQNPRAVGKTLKSLYPSLYLDIQYGSEYKAMILAVTQRFFGSTYGLLALAIWVAALGVANTLGMNLSERSHEMAVLRTLGFTRRQLMQAIWVEGILVVCVGTFLGLINGILLSHVVTGAANALTGYRIDSTLSVPLMVFALLASPAIGILSALIPARRIARLSPASALHSAETF